MRRCILAMVITFTNMNQVDLLIQRDESIIGHLPDELLDNISCIFVDEAHKRGIHV